MSVCNAVDAPSVVCRHGGPGLTELTGVAEEGGLQYNVMEWVQCVVREGVAITSVELACRSARPN